MPSAVLFPILFLSVFTTGAGCGVVLVFRSIWRGRFWDQVTAILAEPGKSFSILGLVLFNLPDGRRITAELLCFGPGEDALRLGDAVEIIYYPETPDRVDTCFDHGSSVGLLISLGAMFTLGCFGLGKFIGQL